MDRTVGSSTRFGAMSLVGAVALVSVVVGGGGTASAAVGDIDTGFGRNGVLAIGSTLGDIERTPQGGLIVAGGKSQAVVARYTESGRIDKKFGHRGVVTLGSPTNDSVTYDRARFIARHGNGWVVATVDTRGITTTWRITRLRSKGSVDGAFGEAGDAIVSAEEGPVIGMEVDSQLRILVLRSVSGGPVVTRFRANGTLDRGFGSDGSRRVSSSGSPLKLVLDDHDGADIALTSGSGTSAHMWLVHVGSGGKLSHSFGGDGTADIVVPSHQGSTFASLNRLPDGRLVVGGGSTSGDSRRIMFATRLDGSGLVDTSFGSNGFTIIRDPIWSIDQGSATVDSSGRVYLTGITFSALVMARLDPEGRPDSSWGPGGVNSPDLPGLVTAWVQQGSAMTVATYYPFGVPQYRVLRLAI